ncbi:MAG TPA: pyruvoyl-dependent arginine decarboxylase [Candidatus Saccharimonadales bacterium]|nr:pyruvoyl-dependent arginine decarboxylase [Candidatus Saccharimonadales bacterium]
MEIFLVEGVGTGPTTLAAFDASLRAAGIANFNIIPLSSIIPPQSKIEVVKSIPKTQEIGNWGDRLYVVIANKRVDTPNEEAWAGIGWVQNEENRKGLFVEHVGSNKKTVERDIRATLESLMDGRKDETFGEITMEIVGITCTQEPVSALVCAVYKSSPWDRKFNPFKK